MSLLISGGGLPPSDLSLNKGKYSPLFARFKGFIRKERLFGQNESILAAVSGGPDSICLLNLLFLLSRTWSLRLAAAHFDHGLRGEESKRDLRFVQEICRVNSIPLFTDKADVREIARERKVGIQEAARQVRYAFFRHTADKEGMKFTATGHTCDDQAEEIIFRLIRGSGPEGLSGIKIKRADGVIRPLLFCRKEEILEHLKNCDIPFVSDSSNLQVKYTRNRIRNLILPLIEKEINPSAVHAIYRAGRLLSEEDEALDSIAESIYNSCSKTDIRTQGIVLDRKLLLDLPKAVRKRVYKKAMLEAGVTPGHIRFDHLEKTDEIALSSSPSSSYNLPGKYRLVKNYNALCFLHETRMHICTPNNRDAKEDFSLVVRKPGGFRLPAGSGELFLEETGCGHIPKGGEKEPSFPRTLYVSLDETDLPFRVTFRHKGDKFHPFGWDRELRLKKFLINRRVYRFFRDILPIIRKEDKIVAVCGVEISQMARIRPGSSRCLKILWKPERWLTVLGSLKNPPPSG